MNVVSVHFFFLHVHVPMLCEMSASAVEVEVRNGPLNLII